MPKTPKKRRLIYEIIPRALGTRILRNSKPPLQDVNPASSSTSKNVIIIGAGVTALQTALTLLMEPTSTPYTVTVIAAHLPGDESIAYTSPWAGGVWRPHSTYAPEEKEAREWDELTYKVWRQILGNQLQDPPEKGILTEEEFGGGVRESVNYWGAFSDIDERKSDGSGLWWTQVPDGFEILDLESLRKEQYPTAVRDGDGDMSMSEGINGNGAEKEVDKSRVPNGAVFGVKYQTICLNVPRYLSFLLGRLRGERVQIIKEEVDTSKGLGGVVKHAKEIFLSHCCPSTSSAGSVPSNPEIFAVINCTGISARHFVGEVESAKLYPILGQTLLIEGEASSTCHFSGFGPDKELDMAYVIPRPGSGTTIFGGCRREGNWSETVNEDLSKKILENIGRFRMAEELRTGDGVGKEEFQVLSSQVGWRPGRKGGPRVEVEKGGRLDGTWVLHSYGHAGAGYQNSIGSADKVRKLLSSLWQVE